MSETGVFSQLSDDVILKILHKLEEDPRNWARVGCVSTKFSSIIRTICCRAKCARSIPAVVSDLLPSAGSAAAPPGGWTSLYKLSVCCPGLLHSGVLLDSSDFGLEREIGPDENYREKKLLRSNESEKTACYGDADRKSSVSAPDCTWSLYDDLLFGSLYDDLLFDTLYNDSESLSKERAETPEAQPEVSETERVKPDFTARKRRKVCRSLRSHLASGIWNLSREQGNKLLASRFKGDCLYICDWPGCVHVEEKRNYMLFRGVFKNFKQSRVWRTINDGKRSKIDLNCVFCSSKQTWDLHSSFCLRRYFGYHDDGEPVVRAYVCENGHVSGAWTNWPLYT